MVQLLQLGQFDLQLKDIRVSDLHLFLMPHFLRHGFVILHDLEFLDFLQLVLEPCVLIRDVHDL